MITQYVYLVLRENLETVGNPRHKIMCRERIGLSAKCANFWLSGRHVADMYLTDYSYYSHSRKSTGREFFVPARTLIGVKLLINSFGWPKIH